MSMHERNALPSCAVRDRSGHFVCRPAILGPPPSHAKAEWADNFAAISIEKRGKDSDPEFFSADINSRVRPSACFSIAPCSTAAGMSFRRQKVQRHHGGKVDDDPGPRR